MSTAEDPGQASASLFDFPPGSRKLKVLKVAVIVMGVILILGFAGVIARIVYLVSKAGPPARAAIPGAAVTTLVPEARVTLPADAVTRSVSFSGSRIALHYEAPAGSGILIVDLETGQTLSRISIGQERR